MQKRGRSKKLKEGERESKSEMRRWRGGRRTRGRVKGQERNRKIKNDKERK